MDLLKAVEELDMESSLWELTDKITAWTLIESAENTIESIDNLTIRGEAEDLPSFLKEDLEYNKRYLSALSIVLDHWTVEDEIPKDIRQRLDSYRPGK